MEHMITLQHSLEEVMLQPALEPKSAHHSWPDSDSNYALEDASSPPQTRSTRSISSASRNSNRLSLTLPIAPPNPNPSRPTPLSTTTSCFPPTPLDTPSVMSPTDPTDFITAIAAQERRVLELREELSRAELELKTLKKQWTAYEAMRKRAERRNIEPIRPVGPLIDLSDDAPSRQSIDIDRKKALLLGQLAQQQDGPERGRRRVFRGGHTRALSLLSPKKLSDGFAVHEDDSDTQSWKGSEPGTPSITRNHSIMAAQMAKRASWTPRSIHQTNGMKQIAEDFKAGLWTFVEDLRQATVGDEPITGAKAPNGRSNSVASPSLSAHRADQDTIRASAANTRPRVQSAFDGTPTPATCPGDDSKSEENSSRPRSRQGLSRSKTELSKPSKRFSWTPLTADPLDDDDGWENWDSPSVKSPRWSGSTMNGDISPIPEKQDENDTPLKNKGSKTRSSSVTSNKLEELLPPVLNRLAPSNLKREVTEFMEEWERSLTTPELEPLTSTPSS